MLTVDAFARELRKWWSFDDRQFHTHSWHSREDFIAKKLPELLAGTPQPDATRMANEDQVTRATNALYDLEWAEASKQGMMPVDYEATMNALRLKARKVLEAAYLAVAP